MDSSIEMEFLYQIKASIFLITPPKIVCAIRCCIHTSENVVKVRKAYAQRFGKVGAAPQPGNDGVSSTKMSGLATRIGVKDLTVKE